MTKSRYLIIYAVFHKSCDQVEKQKKREAPIGVIDIFGGLIIGPIQDRHDHNRQQTTENFYSILDLDQKTQDNEDIVSPVKHPNSINILLQFEFMKAQSH